MSTVVYQGLQSGLESQLKESRTLKLKLSSPKVVFPHSIEMAVQSPAAVPAEFDSKKLDGPNLAGWSSLHDLQKDTSETPCEKLQSPYVHPSAKHSSWWLSEKSLSLCTENLGSETGSDFIENSVFSSPACSTYEKKIPVKREQREVRCRPEAKKQFPPPLTTLGGTDYLHVRPHREDGRLILKATRTPARRSCCFQVDRSNGRLRLTFTDSSMKVCSSNYSKQNDGDEKLANEVTDKEDNTDGKLENNNQESSSSIFDDETSMEAERVESKKILDQQRTAASSCCRCNQSHKKNNNNNNNATKKGLMTSMVQLEPWFLVASS